MHQSECLVFLIISLFAAHAAFPGGAHHGSHEHLGDPSGQQCSVRNLEEVFDKSQDVFVYAITQDCQVVFARASQLHLLAGLTVDRTSRACAPHTLQLQLMDRFHLRLLFERDGNLCFHNITIPNLKMLYDDKFLTYPIGTALEFAPCSQSAFDFQMKPDLAFPDSAYSDVIYFVNPSGGGEKWKVRQVLLSNGRHLKMMRDMFISNFGESKDVGGQYVVALDNEKNYLYKRQRHGVQFDYACAFDMLFRPNEVREHSGISRAGVDERSGVITSIAVDKQVMMFVRTEEQGHSSSVYAQRVPLLGPNLPPFCIAHLPFQAEVGFFRLETFVNLARTTLPSFEHQRHARTRQHVTRTTTRMAAAPQVLRTTPATTTTSRSSTTVRSTTQRSTQRIKATTATEPIISTAASQEEEYEYDEEEVGEAPIHTKVQPPSEADMGAAKQQAKALPVEDATESVAESSTHSPTPFMSLNQSSSEAAKHACERSTFLLSCSLLLLKIALN